MNDVVIIRNESNGWGLTDALGRPLRDEPLHTFANGSAWPEVTFEQVAATAREVNARVFRWRSLKWFADRYLERIGWMP